MPKSKDIVRSMMSKPVRTVQADQPLKVAVARMTDHNIGSLVVVKGEVSVGIITERDIIRELAREPGNSLSTPCSDLASVPLVTVGPDMDVWDAFVVMLRNKIRRLPVMNDGKLVGILSERDLFKWVVRVIYEPNLPEDIAKLLSQNQ